LIAVSNYSKVSFQLIRTREKAGKNKAFFFSYSGWMIMNSTSLSALKEKNF